jgi:hypothetical protein
MTKAEYLLCQRGVLLFLLAMLLGFFVPAFPVKQMVLGVHQAALESGIFLIAAGVLWPKLAWSARKALIVARVTWMSFYGLMLGLTCAALIAGKADVPGAGKTAIFALNVGTSVLLLAITVMMLFAFRGVAVKE